MLVGQARIIEGRKGNIKVEGLNTCCRKGCVRSRDRAVQKSFDGLNFSHRCTFVTGVVNTITTYGETNTVSFCFCGSYCGNDATVSDCVPCRNRFSCNEMYCVGVYRHVSIYPLR